MTRLRLLPVLAVAVVMVLAAAGVAVAMPPAPHFSQRNPHVSGTNLIVSLGLCTMFSTHQTKCFIHNHYDKKYNSINNKFCGGGGRAVTI